MEKIDLPQQLIAFHEKFKAISKGLQDAEVFEDLLDFTISQFSFDFEWKPRNSDVEYKKTMVELFHALLFALNDLFSNTDLKWFDVFGVYYEAVIASKNRRDMNGQFFTPAHVVDLMVGMQFVEGTKNETVLDPCSGSGRFLIAYHGTDPSAHLYASDIDYTCVKMTICNYIFHGCIGEVVWQDSLNPDSYFGGWKIKPLEVDGMLLPIMQVCVIAKEESRIWSFWKTRKDDIQNVKSAQNTQKEIIVNNHIQLNLF